MKSILIVDDNDTIRLSLTRLLRSRNYQIEEARSGKEAIQKAETQKYDVILLDLIMPDVSGIEVLVDLKKIRPSAEVILMTGFATIDIAVETIKKGAYDFIQKPIDLAELDTILRRCIEESRFHSTVENLNLDYTLSSLSNPLRRKIIKLLKDNKGMHLMNITRELEIEDHTKVVFHLKMLKNSAIIKQDTKKGYFLTNEGEKTLACLHILENHHSI